jgi:SAM-dependent methyltransferase
MKTIKFKDKIYPEFQSQGFAAQFAFPYARHFCQGKGYDIGCNRTEWAYPSAIPLDVNFSPDFYTKYGLSRNKYNANMLPSDKVDYIFSSHCLEHLNDWVGVLDYWMTKVKSGGCIFLYLPHRSQRYWQPQNNRKHIHSFDQEMIVQYFEDRNCPIIFHSEGYDLNNSFYVIAQMP